VREIIFFAKNNFAKAAVFAKNKRHLFAKFAVIHFLSLSNALSF
jgi:hypothetical protein